jgi:hypothetical protein
VASRKEFKRLKIRNLWSRSETLVKLRNLTDGLQANGAHRAIFPAVDQGGVRGVRSHRWGEAVSEGCKKSTNLTNMVTNMVQPDSDGTTYQAHVRAEPDRA